MEKQQVDTATHMYLSIITPAHNEEKGIGACLEALLKEIKRAEKEADTEIIVVDNASTDRTREVAERFPGVRVVREEHKGLTWAREAGRKAARGELLAYIDSDVHVPPGWIDIIYREFAQRKNIVSLSGPSRYYDLQGLTKLLAEVGWNVFAPITYRLVGYMLYGANFVATREALEAIGGFDTKVAFYGEDTNLARRLSKVGKTVFLMRFYVLVSGRRIVQEGLLKTYWTYAKNYLSEVFLHEPVTKEYKDHR